MPSRLVGDSLNDQQSLQHQLFNFNTQSATKNHDSNNSNGGAMINFDNTKNSLQLSMSLSSSSLSSNTSGTNKSLKFDRHNLLSNIKFSRINTFLREELAEIRHAVEDDIDYHNTKDHRASSSSVFEARSIVIERQGGLANRFVLFLLFLWYLFSAFTLYTNKYIVATRKLDPTLVGACQMVITCVCGFVQLKKTAWQKTNRVGGNHLIMHHSTNVDKLNCFDFKKYASILFMRNMFIIGLLRLFSIVLGLMALKSASVSFVETIKSSSPMFTVFVSQFIIGEITGFWTKISLFPIMLGLALCSSFELNFSVFGFLAAALTNLTECLQCVFSKLLLCSDQYKFTPLEVQFFSSASSMLVLVPTCYLSVHFSELNLGFFTLLNCLINGVSFHLQTLLAFTLMSYISPVTYSVCNTLKRAVLIWFSVYIFQNPIGYMSAVGTFMVILGVLLYNHAKNVDNTLHKAKSTSMNKI